MKTRISLLLLCLFFTGMFLWSCLDYTIITKVYADGRLERIIQIKGDSAKVLDGSFPLQIDTSWEVSHRYVAKQKHNEKADSVYQLSMRKIFRNAEELNKSLTTDSLDLTKIKSRVSYKRKNKWFHTHYIYSDTYRQHFPFKYLPVTDFLDDYALHIYYAEPKSLALSSQKDSIIILDSIPEGYKLVKEDSMVIAKEVKVVTKKFENWYINSILHAYFDVYKEKDFDSSNSMQLAHLKTSVLKYPEFTDNITKLEAELSSLSLTNALASYADSGFVWDLYQTHQNDFLLMDSLLANMYDPAEDDFTNKIIMPGILVQTNATNIDGTDLTWEFEFENFFAKDYTMMAESKILNYKSIIVFSILLIGLLGILLLFLLRKKESA